MVYLSSKENRRDRLVEVLKRFASLGVVRFARFNGLVFGFEFAYLDQGEIIPLVQYGIALGCVICVVGFHDGSLNRWQVTNQAFRPVQLDAVLIGEAAAVCWTLQVLCKAHHGAGGSVPTGDDALMGSVEVIVVPYDDGELFCLHGGSLEMGLAPRFGYRVSHSAIVKSTHAPKIVQSTFPTMPSMRDVRSRSLRACAARSYSSCLFMLLSRLMMCLL
jgi:hypothetical protein